MLGLNVAADGHQETMRLVSVLLFVAGLALALLGPLVWPGRLPVVLGAVCVLAAALLAARASRRRGWLALGGIVAAVVLFLAPGLVNDWRNGRGIAWEVPHSESVKITAAGYAITSDIGDGRAETPTTLSAATSTAARSAGGPRCPRRRRTSAA